MKNRKLLPCPFCGGDAYAVKRGTKYGAICFVQCEVCGAQTRAKNCREPVESEDWNDTALLDVSHLWNNRFYEKE